MVHPWRREVTPKHTITITSPQILKIWDSPSPSLVELSHGISSSTGTFTSSSWVHLSLNCSPPRYASWGGNDTRWPNSSTLWDLISDRKSHSRPYSNDWIRHSSSDWWTWGRQIWQRWVENLVIYFSFRIQNSSDAAFSWERSFCLSCELRFKYVATSKQIHASIQILF